jgi:hypothetical protein
LSACAKLGDRDASIELKLGDGAIAAATFTVILCNELDLDHRIEMALESQHNAFKWMEIVALTNARDVHFYTKVYFKTDPGS